MTNIPFKHIVASTLQKYRPLKLESMEKTFWLLENVPQTPGYHCWLLPPGLGQDQGRVRVDCFCKLYEILVY